MSKIKFGIIGCGMIAKWHIGAIKEIADAVVEGVFDINYDYCKKIATENEVKAYKTIEEMLSDTEIDVVNICTPSGLHAELIIKAAEAKKHIVVEKPMAITTKQLDEVVVACDKNNVKLCSISQLRFTNAIKQLKQAATEGRLGTVVSGDIYMKYHRSTEYYSNSSWRGTQASDGGGALMNQGIHGVDLLQYILGPVKSVYGKKNTLVHNIEVEDTLSAVVEFENKAIGVVQATTSIYPGYNRKLQVCGSKGSITIVEDSIDSWEIEGEEIPADVILNNGEYNSAYDPADFSLTGHILQITDMVDAIKNDRKPFIDQHEGRKPVDIILAIYKSAEEDRPIFLNKEGN